ncbi:MAG TPA: ABC transporter ATP-binding protein [Pseudonocardia sp.]|nr:ABC transporter ATP-binding protein [Pseudonocardia sp.]
MNVDAERPPLIGSDEVTTPYWAEGYERQARAGSWEVARAAPRTIGVLVGWAWRASPRLTMLTLGVELVSAVVTALGLLATASVFTRLLEAGPTPGRVVAALPALALVVAAGVLRGGLQTAVGALEAALVPKIEQRAQDELYAGLLGVDLLAFDDPDFTGLIERGERGIISINMGARRVGDLVAAAVSVTAAVVAAGVLHPVLAPLVLLTALPQAWATLRGAQLKLASFVRIAAAERRRDITSELIAERANAAEIRAFTTQRALLAEHRRLTAEVTAENAKVDQQRNLMVTAGRALAGAGAGVGYVVLGLLLYTGGLPLALAGTAVVAMRTAAQAIGNGVYAVNALFEMGIYVGLFGDCIADIGARARPAPTRRLTGDPTVVELTDVSFRYPAQERDAVHGVHLTLRRGEVVALVGENGSGKTTLAKLITGLYLPSGGAVRWDGVDIAQVDPLELQDRVAVVLQEPLRWPVTATDNIRIGRLDREDADGSAFADAARRSGADTVLADLPDGPGTVLSRKFQNGRDLSGGQWQRVSVARGLYRNSALVVADEPTSAMDARAEHAVFAALQEFSANHGGRQPSITVLVTHRLANVRHADQIIVLEGGRITERGTHDELMATAGTYRQLFSLQAHAYRD